MARIPEGMSCRVLINLEPIAPVSMTDIAVANRYPRRGSSLLIVCAAQPKPPARIVPATRERADPERIIPKSPPPPQTTLMANARWEDPVGFVRTSWDIKQGTQPKLISSSHYEDEE